MQSALQLAKYTENLNKKRKSITEQDMRIVNQIIARPKYKKANVLVIFDPRLHSQVVGIEASRVVQKTNKPTDIIGHMTGDPSDVFRGSGRSIPEYNLFIAMNALAPNPSNPNKKPVDMISFGGHPMACGFSIKKDQINRFRSDLLNEHISKKLGHVAPTVHPDFSVKPSQLSLQLINHLKALEPFGVDNEAPLLCMKLSRLFNLHTMGKSNKCLNFTLGYDSKSTRAVNFNLGHDYTELASNPRHYYVLGTVGLNYFRGQTSVQFVFQHLKHFTMPITRNLLADVYKHLIYLTHIQPSVNFATLNGFTNEDTHEVAISLKIFQELHLLDFDNGKNIILKHPKQKKSLLNSHTYRRYSVKH